MPNWCYNRVEISGTPDVLEEFAKKVESEDEVFSFQSIVPMPEELQNICSPTVIVETEEDVEVYIEEHKVGDYEFVGGQPMTEVTRDMLLKEYGAENWYDWANNNWGCKWDVRDVERQNLGDYIHYQFETAWGPPKEICDALRKVFPDLDITWFFDEPGMRVAGYL